MPEKIVIAELGINLDDAVKDTIRLKEEVALLKAQTEKAKNEQGEMSAEYIQYSAALKATQGELRTQENLMVKLSTANTTQTGSINQMQAQLAIVSKKWAALSKEERENSEDGKLLTAQKLELTNALKAEEKATGDTRRNVGNYSEAIMDAKESIIGMVPGLSTASNAAKGFGITLNWSLLPITAVIAAVAALVSYFKRTEEGSNKLNKIMAVFNVVLENVMDIVGKVGEAIFNAFENPKKSVADLWEAIKVNVMNRLVGFIDAWKALGKVIKGVFTLSMEDIKKGAEEFGESFVQTMTGVDDAIGKAKRALSGFIDEQKREMDIASRIADQKAALRKKEREEIKNDARDELQIAELRAMAARKDKYDGEQRLKMLDKAIAIENEMMQDDLKIAQIKANIHAQEIAMSDSSAEALDEQSKLEADIFNIQKANAEARRGFESQRQLAINDMIADQKIAAEESIELLNYELEVWKIKNKEKVSVSEELTKNLIESENIRITEQNLKEAEILKQKIDNKLISENDYNLAILALEDQKNIAISELNKSFEEQEKARKIEAAVANFENDQAMFEDNALAQLDKQKALNDKQKQQELLNAEKTHADKSKIEAKFSKADLELEKAKTSAKLSLAAGFASNIATIAGENTKVGKAAAVAAATINTYQAATGAYAALAPIPLVGPALGIAAAAAAVVSGIANVKKILAVQPGSTPSGDSASPADSGSSSPVSSLQSVNTDIGQGIVSRQTETASQNANQGRTVAVVIDDVTAKQQSVNGQVNASVI